MSTKRIALFAAAVLIAGACNMISSLIHDDQVVARVGRARLYRSELDKYIPDGVSPEDSAGLALQYINSWATERLYVRMAESQLGKEEKNVDRELEDYRRSLLRYRYEQNYINDRLDTLVTEDQVKEYYDAHREGLDLQRPILKVRFVDVMSDSPNFREILSKLPADGGQDLADLDSLAYISALRWFDNSSQWMDAALLAREFGTDYATMLSKLRDGYIVFDYEDRGDVKAAYVFSILRSGPAPLDFCAPGIRDNILSERKRNLMQKLEQDLLTNALDKKDFVIY